MSEASKLIERMERETGQRNDGDNNAMAGLLGAMSRMLGKSPDSYKERDDVAVGIVMKHQMSPEYEREQASNEMLVRMLMRGMSSDNAKDLME